MQNHSILVASFIFASALSASAAAQNAADGAASASQPGAAASRPGADPDRIICHYDQETGSKIPKKICKTAAAWEWDRERSLKLFEDAQQHTGTTRGR